MNEFVLSPKALVMVQGSSKGTQPKYYESGYWYKADHAGYEGLAEYLVSLVLACSNVSDYVTYERCKINGKPGCRSKSFLNPRESFMSFERLYNVYSGKHLLDTIMTFSEISERINYVKKFILDFTGTDCSVYLSQILTLDMLSLNTDRHFNNLGIVIDNETGSCRPAPIFDNGNSLLSDWNLFHEDSIEKNAEHVYGKPFCANLQLQAYEAGFGLKLDYNRLYKIMEAEPDSRALQVLKYQLEKVREMIPDIGTA